VKQGRLLPLDEENEEHIEQLRRGEATLGVDAEDLFIDINQLEAQGLTPREVLAQVKRDLGVVLGFWQPARRQRQKDQDSEEDEE